MYQEIFNTEVSACACSSYPFRTCSSIGLHICSVMVRFFHSDREELNIAPHLDTSILTS